MATSSCLKSGLHWKRVGDKEWKEGFLPFLRSSFVSTWARSCCSAITFYLCLGRMYIFVHMNTSVGFRHTVGRLLPNSSNCWLIWALQDTSNAQLPSHQELPQAVQWRGNLHGCNVIFHIWFRILKWGEVAIGASQGFNVLNWAVRIVSHLRYFSEKVENNIHTMETVYCELKYTITGMYSSTISLSTLAVFSPN